MGRILATDKRYKMLLRLPRVRDGRVVFRKKPGRAKFVIAIFEIEDEVHSVLYRISNELYDGRSMTIMSFCDCLKK